MTRIGFRTATAACLAIAALLVAAPPRVASAIDCTQTSVGLTPINDLGAGLYLGLYEGGLYPGGLDTPPPAHRAEGVLRAAGIVPLDPAGDPDPAGHYVLVSIGMSNTTQEFCSREGLPPCNPWTFMGRADGDPRVNHRSLVIVNGARGGQSAEFWEDPDSPNYDRIRDDWLTPRGLSEQQVVAAWVKVADPRPTVSLPDPAADAFELLTRMGNIMRALKVRYPNLRVVFLSSRIYAGYATSNLNPEPYAYESGFAVKWLIEAQIDQMATGTIDPLAGDLDYTTVAPWIAWGPYLWADGLVPRSDGLIWTCDDFEPDGTHPAQPAEEKVGTLLLRFFLNSPFARPWFRDPCGGADLDGNGSVDLLDLSILLGNFGTTSATRVEGDLDGDGDVDIVDLSRLLNHFGLAGCQS